MKAVLMGVITVVAIIFGVAMVISFVVLVAHNIFGNNYDPLRERDKYKKG